MKNFDNIPYIDFQNVNIALNSHSYEKRFLLEFINHKNLFKS